jgi:hypothetical protein
MPAMVRALKMNLKNVFSNIYSRTPKSLNVLLAMALLLQGYLAISQNILISTEHSPNEPAIIMDPKHPNVLIGASNIRNYYVSQDTGRTWTSHLLSSTNGVWGDPALTVDTSGAFYFFHLSNPASGNWIDRIVCQKSEDQGETWSDGSYTGLNGTKAQDKHWPVVDPANNMIYVSWTQFDSYGSTNPSDSSIILFSKSADAGLTWSDPVRINKLAGDCIDSDSTVEGAVPAVGPNGEVYVAWAGPKGLTFNKSLDEGEHWLDEERVISDIPGGWDYSIPGIFRANGLPVTVCDLSPGPHRGTIYINWSDQRNGIDDTDVWLTKSVDGGETWTPPIRVNDDPAGKQQFFTYMAVDQATGYLYFVFYDRRNYEDNSTDVYMAVSQDGGETFINRKISESPFIPMQGIFFGDYTNLTVYNGIVRPIWTRLNNGQLSIWTHLTTADELITGNYELPAVTSLDFESYPNPTGRYFYVTYETHQTSKINLSLMDLRGKVIAHILRNQRKPAGLYVEPVDVSTMGLSPGIYLIRVEVDKVVKVIQQVIID